MISSILVVLSYAAMVGLDLPEPIKPFKSNEACLVEAAKLSNVHAEDLRKAKSVFACLVIVVPAV
jgi:hypothetical protein